MGSLDLPLIAAGTDTDAAASDIGCTVISVRNPIAYLNIDEYLYVKMVT